MYRQTNYPLGCLFAFFNSLIPITIDYYKDERYADFYTEFNRIKADQIGLVEELILT